MRHSEQEVLPSIDAGDGMVSASTPVTVASFPEVVAVGLDLADTSTPNASADSGAKITTCVDAGVVGTDIAEFFDELDCPRHALAQMVEGVGFVVFEKAPFAQMLVNPKFVLDGAEMLDEACRRLAGLEG